MASPAASSAAELMRRPVDISRMVCVIPRLAMLTPNWARIDAKFVLITLIVLPLIDCGIAEGVKNPSASDQSKRDARL